MRIYLAGPMRGYPELNFPAFDEAAARALAAGHDPVNPADLDRQAGFCEKDFGGAITQDFIRECIWRDVTAIVGQPESELPSGVGVDAVAMLPGWENSRGAKAEKAIAEWLGLQILDARTFETLAEAA